MPNETIHNKKGNDHLLLMQVFELVIKALRVNSPHADREQVLSKLPPQLKLRWQDKQKEF